ARTAESCNPATSLRPRRARSSRRASPVVRTQSPVRSSALAAGTIVRAALRDHAPGDQGAAAQARLVGSCVDVALVLVAAVAAVRGDVVADARTAGLDGASQYLLRGLH